MNIMNQNVSRKSLVAACISTFFLAHSATAQQFDISWYTIDSGGGNSAGGVFQLSGTIGQPDAGVMSGGPYTLTGGFWSGAPASSSCYADCDTSTGQGVLDIFDFLCFQNSFVAGEPYACDCDTSTGVGVCDIFDFLCFQNAFVAGCP